MGLYMYQLAYTPESLKALVANPQDRMETAAKPLIEGAGGKILAAGYSFGDYDIVVIYEAPDDATAAGVAIAVGAGGGIRAGHTTKLLTGAEWIDALRKAGGAAGRYQPPR